MSFLTTKGVEHPVGDRTLTFYPVSLRVAPKALGLLEPVVKAIGTLVADGASSTDSFTERTFTKPSGEIGRETIHTPPDATVIKARQEIRDKAIAEVVRSLLDRKNGVDLAEILVDSLRDEFPRNPRPKPKEIEAWWDEVDLAHAVDLVTGLVKANRSVFDPFMEALGGHLRAAQGSFLSPRSRSGQEESPPAEEATPPGEDGSTSDA